MFKPTKRVVQGNASQLLLENAKKQSIDLMVMGKVGRGGIAVLIIGNTAESVLSQLNCSALVGKVGWICFACCLIGSAER